MRFLGGFVIVYGCGYAVFLLVAILAQGCIYACVRLLPVVTRVCMCTLVVLCFSFAVFACQFPLLCSLSAQVFPPTLLWSPREHELLGLVVPCFHERVPQDDE